MVRTMPYMERPLNEIRKYDLVDIYNNGRVEKTFDTREEAESAQNAKERSGEFNFRVHVDVTRNHVLL